MQSFSEKEMMHYYELNYRDTAAYFQYGWTSASMPVPFGKNEVVYLMQNKRTDSIYGLSPVALLSDILYTLIYGSMYNLDFYNNNNMPEGFMSVLGASTTEIRATKERFESQFREKDKNTGFFRRVAYRLPWTNHEVKFTPFQLDPKTMQVIEQQQWFTKIVWACFGVTPDEMGFTDNSNRATTENQSALAKEKATKPILNLLAYHINQEIMPEFESNDFEFKFVDYNLDVEHKKYDLYLKQIQAGVMTPEMIAEEEGIDVAKVKAAQEEKKEMEMMAMAPKPSTDKKALLIKEVPDEIDEVYDFKVGDSVKVVSGTKAFEDKVGVVEKIVNNKTVIVRFDVGIDIFSSEQLVLIQEDEEGVSTIKAKDPFNNTAVEKKMLDDIHKSSKKIREALKLLK
jgi:transcription antitermination factor NusG